MVDAWRAIANKVSWGIYLSDGTRVALVNTALDKQEAKARLIAAAPDLLAALIRAEQLAVRTPVFSETLSAMRAAIAKATGATPDLIELESE